ncbi:UNVERIFIED_CONTAM: hypothetical protein Sindi_0422700 [Sesamum indicum]
MQWMKDGDQCSRIFFCKIAQRRATRRILQINDEHGTTYSKLGAVIHEFVSFYQALLGGERRRQVIDIRYLRPWARHILNEEEGLQLLTPVIAVDVKQAMFDIAEDKAPGLDGFSSSFYNATWPIVGLEVTKAILEFFTTEKLLKQINTTLLELIPKGYGEQLLVMLGFQEGHLPMSLYLTSAFILPKGVIREIEKRLRAFLWKGTTTSGYAKVAWRDVCRPASEGARNWVMLFDVIEHQSDGNIMGGYMINLKLLRLHPLLRSMVDYQIGEGNSFYLWNDPWHHLGPLIERFPRGPRLLGLGMADKLSSVIMEGQWHWPLITDIECLEILHALSIIHGETDHIIWRFETGRPTIASLYRLLDLSGPKIGWSSLFSGFLKIPKHNVILWLVILEKLSTAYKPWLSYLGDSILYDEGAIETHTHLFF